MTQTSFFNRINRMNRPAIVAGLIIVLAFVIPLGAAQAYTGYPTFDILSVEKDVSVTVQTNNLPPNQTFTVRMGKLGTKAIDGEIVKTFDSAAGGTQKLTFNIPAALKGLAYIAIRMDSPAGYYAYNWFTNSTFTTTLVKTGTAAAGTKTATPSPTKTPSGTVTASKTPTKTPTKTGSVTVTATPKTPPSTIPTFSIIAVVRDSKVTIKTSNFPANQTFTVRMGPSGTRAIGGTVVGTTESGTGGSFEATYNIPDGLKGSTIISIRMDSPKGYYAYNWFWNNNAP